jgi:uncharacterized surface protein with fasciclin (FAS1) repeats
MNRKLISFVSAGATAIVLLSACGGNTAANPTSAPSATITSVPVATVAPATTAPEATTTSVMTSTEMMTSTTMPGASEMMTPTEMMTGTTMPGGSEAMTSTEMMTGTESMSGTSMMEMDIAEVAMGNSQFTTLVAALQAAGLTETLKGDGPFTVFAPTDAAFAKLDPTALANLLKPENKDQLVKILTYHVVAGKVLAADVMKMTSAKTLEGSDLTIKVDGSTVMVNDAKVIMTDIQTKNGVIHAIDTVLMPTTK